MRVFPEAGGYPVFPFDGNGPLGTDGYAVLAGDAAKIVVAVVGRGLVVFIEHQKLDGAGADAAPAAVAFRLSHDKARETGGGQGGQPVLFKKHGALLLALAIGTSRK